MGRHIYRKLAPRADVAGRQSARPSQVSAAPPNHVRVSDRRSSSCSLVWDNTFTSCTCGQPADPDLAYVEPTLIGRTSKSDPNCRLLRVGGGRHDPYRDGRLSPPTTEKLPCLPVSARTGCRRSQRSSGTECTIQQLHLVDLDAALTMESVLTS
jgi:hypothetical protein